MKDAKENKYVRAKAAKTAAIAIVVGALLSFGYQMFTTPPPGLNYVTITWDKAINWLATIIVGAALAAWLATREWMWK